MLNFIDMFSRQKPPRNPRVALRCCVFLAGVLFSLVQANAATDMLQSDVSRSAEVSNSESAKAIERLNAIYDKQFATASLEDKRAMLIALISLYLNVNQPDHVRKLNVELNQLATDNHDELSRVMALNFQASLLIREGKYDEANQLLSEGRQLASNLFVEEISDKTSGLAATGASVRGDSVLTPVDHQYLLGVEQQTQQLQQTIYILSAIVAMFIVLSSYVLYRRVSDTNRRLILANAKLEIQSTTDPLTGLPNRRAFHDAMKVRMQKVERRVSEMNQPPHVLALIDIDHFKLINDRFGSEVGDKVLIEVSSRLSKIMRDQDKLMRWGGQEFLIFLNNISTENLDRVITRVLEVVGATPMQLGHGSLNVKISVGFISLAHGKDSDVDEHWEKSMKLADAALYKAKLNGRNQAFGIQQHTIDAAELDAMLTIDMVELERAGKIVVKKIAGPVDQKIAESAK